MVDRQADQIAERRSYDGAYELGQDHPAPAFYRCSVEYLTEVYHRSPTNLCQPISGDATLLAGFQLIH